MKYNRPIDFVITWVDGGDPKWQDERRKYSTEGADVRNSRYRDWDQLKYWFRAVDKYAPWVNKIHFVTWGHIPEWLDITNPKINIVNHKDFIPECYLPVFNSTAIEIHLHKIPRLSSQFVYFCDDFYLMKPCKPTDFFKNGKPVDMVKFTPVMPCYDNEMWYYHLYNDYSVYRKYFSRKNTKVITKFLSVKYGKVLIGNFINLMAHNLYISPLHLPMPLLIESMEKIWRDNQNEFERTALSKFRLITNNSLESVRGYQLLTGNFHTKRLNGIVLPTRDVENTCRIIENCKYRLMCLSDSSEDKDFEYHKKLINKSFDMVFHERCSFEL